MVVDLLDSVFTPYRRYNGTVEKNKIYFTYFACQL